MEFAELKKLIIEMKNKLDIIESINLIEKNEKEIKVESKVSQSIGFRYEGRFGDKNYILTIPSSEYTKDKTSYLSFLFGKVFEAPEECRNLSKYLRNSCYEYFDLIKENLGISLDLDLYEIINKIATLNYEKNEARGRIILIPPSLEDSLNFEITFEKKIDLTEERLIRKLVEISKKDLPLVATLKGFLGFGNFKNLERLIDSPNNIYIIDFLGINDYKVSLGKVEKEKEHSIEKLGTLNVKYYFKEEFLFKVFHGLPKLEKKMTSGIKEIIEKEFENISKESSTRLVEIIKEARKQKKGTILIFIEDAFTEKERFSRQAINIRVKREILSLIHNISSIDGALLFNTNGDCCSMGLILDGIVDSKTGNPSRGARYNSALKYIENRRDNRALAVVISEDGMIDFIYTQNKEEKIKKMLRTAETLEKKGEYKKAIYIYTKIVKENPISETLTKLASLEYNLALNLENENQKEAENYYNMASENYRKAENKLGAANSLQSLAYITNNKKRALELFGQSLKLYESLDLKEERANLLLNMGTLEKEEDPEVALELFEKSLKLYRTLDMKEEKANVLSNIGMLEKKRNPEKSLELLEESLELYMELGDQENIDIVKKNIASYRKEVSVPKS